MENKTRKMKWTKKLRAVIISLSLAFAVALGGACAAIGIAVAGRNGRPGGTLSDSTAGSSDVTPDRTYSAGVEFDEVTYATNADAWAAAVKYSVTEKKIVQFNLERGWTATADANGFATEDAKAVYSDAFGAAGSLTVPANAQVILNIKKNVRLNRNLTEAIDSGEVVSVAGGRLIIQGDGVITGGNTNGNGGGINATENSTVELYGGKITKNIAPHVGGGIYCEDNSTLNIYGGEISYNQTTTSNGIGGGGVALGKVALTMTGGRIINNTSVDWAGGIMTLNRGANLTISGGAISGNTAGIGGGAMFIGADTVSISGTTYIANNNVSAIAVYNNGVLNISGGTITKNESASYGGAITINAGTVTISDGEISENTAEMGGGGIYTAAAGVKNDDGTLKQAGLTISGGEITKNTASSNGGGVYVNENATLTMTGGTISGHHIANPGGGVYAARATVIEMTGGLISDNSTISTTAGKAAGSAICSYGSVTIGGTAEICNNLTNSNSAVCVGAQNDEDQTNRTARLTLNGGKIHDNRSTTQYSGGAVCFSHGTLTINDCDVYNNISASNGGAFECSTNATVIMNGGRIYNNECTGHGGAFEIEYSGSNITINGGEIYGNTAGKHGGAVNVQTDTYQEGLEFNLIVTGGKFYGNTAKVSCGAISFLTKVSADVDGGKAKITGGEFYDNTSLDFSGGIGNDGKMTIQDIVVTGNNAVSGGGIGNSGTLTLINCTVTENTAIDGGGIYNKSKGSLTLINTNITDNNANVSGGGIYAAGATTLNGVTIQNNTASGNGGGIFVAAATTLGGTNIITDNTAGGVANNWHQNTANLMHLITSGSDVFDKTNSRIGLSSSTVIPTGNPNKGIRIIEATDEIKAFLGTTGSSFSCFFGDINTFSCQQCNNATDYEYVLITYGNPPWGVEAYNTAFWSVAVLNSSENEPKVVNLYQNWTANQNSAFAGFYTSTLDSYYKSTVITAQANAENAINNVAFADSGHQLVVPKGKNVILNLNGFNISRNNLSRTNTMFFVAGKLTVNGSGTIGNCTDIVFLVQNGGELILNGATISGSTLTTVNHGVVHLDGGKFTMNGGTVSANPNLGTTSTVMQNAVVVRSNSTFELNGGNINCASRTVTTNGGARGVLNNGTFIMNGGTISGFNLNEAGAGVYSTGNFTMNSGMIGGSNSNRNTTKNAGGGVCVYTGTFTMSGGSIFNNNAAKNGGGVYIGKDASFTMSGGHIETNFATANGGGVFADGEVIISGGEISDNIATASGGGIYISSTAEQDIYGSLEMSGGSIRDNLANDNTYGGGGVFLNGGTTFTMTGGSIFKNDALKNGGGIYVGGTLMIEDGEISQNSAVCGGGINGKADTTITFKNGKITHNSASEYGGGVHTAGTFIMIDGEISYNTAESTAYGGGGIFANTKATLTISGGKIIYNTAAEQGGGIATWAINTISGGLISENTSATQGGGIYFYGDSLSAGKSVITGGTVTNNTAANGGGVYVQSGKFILSGMTISENTATSFGGGLYVSSTVEITGTTTISDNTATSFGGGIHVEGKLTINDGIIERNSAVVRGGAVCCSGTMEMLGGKILNNEVTDVKALGGGVCVTATGTFTMSGDSVISGNVSSATGGGVFNSGLFTMTGGAISGNHSVAEGGGVFVASQTNAGKMTMSGGLISDNYAESNGGGIFVAGELEISGTAQISANLTEYNGGAVFAETTSKFTMKGGVIGGETKEEGNRAANQGGGVIFKNSFTMENGKILNNYAVSGGGVFAFGNKFSFVNGEISGNTSENNGGGVLVRDGATFEMTSGIISGNTAVNGGGVFVSTSGAFTMSGGEISGNSTVDLGRGAGVYVDKSATFEMSDGTISENTSSAHGGGVYVVGTFTMKKGAISENNALYGAGVYGTTASTITMSGGEISGNSSARHGGGVFTNSGTFNMSGGSITGNTAAAISGFGGVCAAGAVNISGNVNITDNKLDDGTVSNVGLGDSIITINGALANTSRIGVSSEAAVPVTITSGYTSSGNTAANARTVFSADKEGVVAVYESNEIVLKQGVVLTVNDDNGNKIGSISTVNGAKVLGAFDEDTGVYTLTEENAAANNVAFASDVIPDGYAAYMYAYGDADKKEISEFTMGTTDATVCVGMKALEREYTIHYFLEGADGSYGTSFLTGTNSGPTDSAVVVLDENGKPFTDQITTPDQYSVDNAKGNWKGATVAGDGSTVVDVYLKLAEYTVTYSAQGATPSRQTRKMKYGATIIAPARTPSKPMSTFIGWMDASGNVIDFATTSIKVTENMTLTAKFDVQTFNLSFNLNIDEAYGIPTDHKLPMYSGELIVPTNAGLEDVDYLVAWDYEKLFPAANGFNFRANEDSYGEFIIDYTIDNIPNTMSIRNVKPTAVGYTFDGWYMTNSSGVEQLVTTISRPNVGTKDIVLTAHWSPAAYTVRFDRQDESWNPVTSDTVSNLCTIEELYVLGGNPTRAGYVFDGWYIAASEDNARYTAIDTNAFGKTDDDKGCFSVAKIADLYGSAESGYDFSNLTLYAKWSSVPVYVVYDRIDNISLTFSNEAGHNGSVGVETQAMHVNDVVTVGVTANNGFRFTNLIVNGRTQSEGVTEFTIRDTYLTDYEYNGVTYKVIRVSAVCTEERYRINYDVDGGTSTSSNFARTYSPSQLLHTSENRAKLSSHLTKQGYDFMGWEFTSNHAPAFTVDSGVDTTKSLYGKDLWMATPTAADGVTVQYREVFLKAIWKAQPATVNLYNATYNNLYEGSPETGYIIEEYGAAGSTSQHLATAMKIEIVNPERSAFNFLGWATSRNGAVVYPAVEGKNTIEYVVNADHDVNGNALNHNNLYAVWHIKGVDRILMSVDNNNATYGGDGITMSAKTAQSYAQGDGETITLTYTWYRIFDGMYDQCFTAGYVYIENEKVTGYEFNGVYYGADGKTEQATAPAGEPFDYKRFETSSVGTGCVLAFTQSRTPTETSTLNIKNVNECGTYVCVVEVVATSSTGSTTRAGGFGEIEISMSKAVYANLELNDKTLTYNAEAQWNSLRIERRNNADGSQFENDDNVIRYVTLPDGSKVIVTYKYYAVEESGRREITDLNEVKGVGRYYVEVTFAFTPDGDKGNYEPLEMLDAEIEIKPFEISNIGFTFVHGGDSTIEQNFAGAYDGTAYSVVAAINQRFDDDGEYVAVKDDVKLVVQVNEVNENGDVEHAGETVSAGRYSVVIIGLQGKDARNYVFKSGVTLRKEYTIGKSVYDVSGKIKFEDKTFVFDNKSHSIEIEWEGEWPETVTPVYEITFEPEEAGFKDSSFDQNNKKIGNDGKNAGIYTVTVEFIDSASDNYEALESMTATLTITKANVFKYMDDTYGEDLLGAAGFVGGSFAYSESNSYLPTVNPDVDCRLNNKTHFAISYKYYEVDETTGVREELGENERISNPGKYEIVANITYASALYRNNFEEVQESESTITYIIRNFIVKNVTVIFSDEFENAGRVVKLGKEFDYGWIKQIDVLHEDADTHVQDTRHIIREEDIALAVIKLENDYSTFWHVGDFDIKVGVYGSDSAAYNVTVKEDVTDFVIKYRAGDEGAYDVIPDDGLRLLTEGEYNFIVEYECTDGRGAPITTSTEAVVAAGGLKLGENVLTATEDYYEFSKIAVNVYKVITGEVTWQYSRDGGLNWYNIADDYPDYVLPYIGSEYLIRVAFTDGGAQSCPAKTASGVPVLNYTRNGYSMTVGRSGNYKIDATYSISVGQRVLEVDWSDKGNGFTYNGLHQSPVIDPNTVNLAAADKGRITFSYQLEDTEGNALTENDVIGVGTYVIKVVVHSDDPTYSENYTVAGSKTAAHTFTIHKADISMDVTYSESNYGPNVTYANNAHGLRLNALQANFKQTAVDGKFAFVKAGATSDEYVEISGDDAEIKGKLTGTESYAYINYAFIPEDDNYNVKIGQFRIDVKSQAYRQSGAESLLIVLGKDAIPHYLVGQTFSTEGIEVYRLYESYYTEGDKWFGFRGNAVTNPTFRLNGNIPANGHGILTEDVSGGMITLVASSGPLSGSLQIPVLDKEVDRLEISNDDFRKVFYIGETYDFSDLVFRVIFKDGTDQDGLTKGSVKCTFDGEEFDTAGEVTLTFSYFDATCELTVTVKERENLQVVDFTTGEKTLIWTGEELTAPALKFLIDGDEYTTYDGITVTYVVRRGQQVVSLLNEGDYSVYYTVTVNNPRFNKITTPILVTVNVTKNPYRVTITVPAAGELTVTYTGDEIEVPKPVISDIIDSRTGNVVQPDAVRYYINGTELVNGLNDTRWVQLSVKEYKVEVVVEVDGREFREEYTFNIVQATNGNLKVEAGSVVLGEGANFKFPVTADFGADSVDDVKYTYSTERNGTYTENVPDKAGIWFVKVTIDQTDDYTGLETVVSFEVRDNKTDASVGDGSIEGGDGIGKDWTLEIKQMESETVSQTSINKQNVLDGYKVELRNEDKVLVKSENDYTVKIKLSEELSGRTDLKVFFKDTDGKTVEKQAHVEDGYIVFKANDFSGEYFITSAVAGAPVGLLVAVIVLGVVAAGGIAACVIVFVKKKRKGAQK